MSKRLKVLITILVLILIVIIVGIAVNQLFAKEQNFKLFGYTIYTVEFNNGVTEVCTGTNHPITCKTNEHSLRMCLHVCKGDVQRKTFNPLQDI